MDWFTLSLSCALFLALADAFTKKFFPTYDGWELLLIRFVVPAFLLIPIAFLYPLPEVPQEFWLWMLLLVPLEIVAMSLYLLAIRDSPLHLTLPYLAFTPVFSVGTAFIFLDESLSLRGLSGVCLVVCGAYLLNINQHQNGKRLIAPLLAIYRERGSRLMLGAALIYSFTSSAGKVAMQHASPESFGPFYFLLIGGCVLVVTLLTQPKKLSVVVSRPVQTVLVGLFMAMMVVTHFLALALVEVAYMISVKRASLLFGIVLGAILFRERHLAQHMTAGSFMVAGVVLILI
jgi:drug/metabolite transporter (DMT)-like permease